MIGGVLARLRVARCRWLLDRPVSNSGRLKGIMEELAAERGWPWSVELVDDPDRLLAESAEVVATADSGILDRAAAWFNLARTVIWIASRRHEVELWNERPISDFAGSPRP